MPVDNQFLMMSNGCCLVTQECTHIYIHTYIDYAMNHKNKQIYSNGEGATGSHRINDHLRVSTIKTAHRRPLNNNTANNNINTTVKVCRVLLSSSPGRAAAAAAVHHCTRHQ